MTACGWCGLVFDGAYHYCQTQLRTAATTTADWEAADMVHRNRLGLAREASAASTVDLLAAENRRLMDELRTLQRAYVTVRKASESAAEGMDALDSQLATVRQELTVATCAAIAANEFYKAEYMGEKTYLTPTETRERFGSAMVAYREATGVDDG